ncbi:MAG TPA: non-ribosomal peptide synthetase, partial [Deltaproteobacteria bacterium]|nr:non-ribosomal peptide synthetase [Deltaproteobacteria bacterium]
LHEAPRADGTEIEDLLLCALGRVFSAWTGAARVAVDVEGHGRSEISDDIDLTRTVGWFTTQFPVLLGSDGQNLADDIENTKEMLRGIPRGGFGFGLLREQGSTRGLVQPGVAFNYLGQLDHVLAPGSGIRLSDADIGPLRDPASARPYILELNGRVEEGLLRVAWTYGSELHDAATVNALASAYLDELRSIVTHCLTPGVGRQTPSDFPLAQLSRDTLDEILAEVGGELEDIYPVNPMQEGLLLQSELDQQGGAYIEQLAIELHGPVHVGALEKAWAHAVQQYETLRSCFVRDADGQGFQVVRKSVPVSLISVAVHATSASERSRELDEFLRRDRQRSFTPARAPLFRLHLVSHTSERQVLVLTHHHAILDGWSIPILLAEVQRAYEDFEAGHKLEVSSRARYRDYADWLLQSKDSESADRFWDQELSGFTEASQIVGKSATRSAAAWDRVDIRLSVENTRGLEGLARDEKVTLGTLVQAAWALLLSHYASSRDILFGITVSGRPTDLNRVDEMVGLFINTLPLRLDVPPEAGLGSWLREVQTSGAALRDWEHVPLSRIQRRAEVPRGQPLFETLLAVENYPLESVVGEGGALNTGAIDYAGQTHYPITIVASPGTELGIRLTVDAARFGVGFAERVGEELREVLLRMTAAPKSRLIDLAGAGYVPEVAAEAAREAAPGAASTEASLAERFTKWAEQRPEAIALECEGRTLSYGELAAQAERIAAGLQARGIGVESRVGLYLERSPAMVATILGVHKAGAAYVPVDAHQPRERVEYIFADAGVDLVVSEGELSAGLPELTADHVDVAELLTSEQAYQAVNVPPEALAYVIYTSGSTGRPKGALVEQRQMSRLFRACEERMSFGPEDVWTLFHSYGFDFSVWELWGALGNGGRVVVVPYWVSRDTQAFYDLVVSEQVTVLSQTPSAFGTFMAEDAERGCDLSLRYVVFGGEALEPRRLEAWSERHGTERPQLINMYGITETTVHVTYAEIGSEEIAASGSWIGEGLPDLTTWVLDGEQRALPIGVEGELYVGGAGLCRGYLGRGGLTAERFVPHPYEDGTRLYRTGDIVCRREDGSLRYVGRRDGQIKLRGHRIELGEIEAAMRELPGVEEAVATLREDGEAKRLVGYVVGTADAEDVRTGLGRELPGYMIPNAVVSLEALPLTGNGKVDRRSLPAPEQQRETYAVPENEVETALSEIWSEVLGVEQVSRFDDFFALGGDSILSIQVVSRAQRRGIFLTPRDVFDAENLQALALLARDTPVVEAEQGEIVGRLSPTPILKWFEAIEQPDPAHWNQALLLGLANALDPSTLRRALSVLQEHHDALRLSRKGAEGHWVQRSVAESEPPPLEEIALAGTIGPETTARIEAACAAAQMSLDLENGRIFRAIYFHGEGTGADRLFLVAHHAAVDGVSWRILIEDLAAVYWQLSLGEAPGLPPKTTSFLAWSERLHTYALSEEVARETAYWSALPWEDVRGLPIDTFGANTESTAREVVIELGESDTEDLLKALPLRWDASIEAALLVAVERGLRRWIGPGALLVDVEGHGREDLFSDVDLSRTVGWFTSQYPVLLDSEHGAIQDDVRAMASSLKATPHKGMGWGLLRRLGAEGLSRELQLLPEASVSFNYLGRLDRALPGSSDIVRATEPIGPLRHPLANRPYLLDVLAQIEDGRLRVQWIFSEAIHSPATIEAAAAEFSAQLKSLVGLAGSAAPEVGDFPLARGLGEDALSAILAQVKG